MSNVENFPESGAKLGARAAPGSPGVGRAAPEGPRQILDHLRVVGTYKWSIALVVLVAGFVGLFKAMSATPIYRAEARVLVKFQHPAVSGLQQLEGTPSHWLFYETQYGIIRSRAVAERVVERLGLDQEGPQITVAPDADPEDPVSGPIESARAWLTELREWIPEEWHPARPPPLPAMPRKQALADGLRGGLQVTGGKESEIIAISYHSADPARAAEVANAVVDAYIEFGLQSRLRTANQNTSWLGQRLDELRGQLETSERTLGAFQSREGMVDTANRETLISSKLATLTAELVKAQSRRGEAQTRYRQLKRVAESGASVDLLPLTVDRPLVAEAHGAVTARRRQVDELDERYGPKHPKMIAARAELEEAERRLEVQLGNGVERARKEFEVAKVQQAELQRLIDRQQVEMRALSGKAFELAKLEREVETNRRLFETFLQRFKEADVAEDYDLTNVRVIDRAQVPRVPVKPDKRRIVIIACAVGLLLGLGLAFLRDHLNRTFRSPGDVERVLGLPVLGSMGHVRVKRRSHFGPERYSHHEPTSQFAESINDVRTALAFCRIDDPHKLILITSAVAGEGKTTLAHNLAVAMSKRGRTLLVDADLRRGRLEELVPNGPAQGLTDVVSGACALEDAVVEDAEVEGLYLLVAGTRPPNPLEVISSAKFAHLLEALRDEFDYVVMDGSPVLPVSDSIVLAHQADGVVLVVQSDRTTFDLGEETVKRLASAGVAPIGVVLQQVDMRRRRYYGRYPYYHGGSYYGGYGTYRSG